MKRILPLLALLAGTAHADVKLPAVLTDHLVLQRGKPVAIWGTADEGEEVTVKFGDQSKKTVAAKDGSWKVALDALTASAESRDLTVKGKNEIILKDILVGEVWLCSGQSNMGMTVNRCINAEAEIAAANDPLLRVFHVPNTVANEPQKDVLKKSEDTRWLATTPQTAGTFTAAGYFFGRELRKELNVPIGLINTSWGGTRAEAWTSKPALESSPTCKPIVTGWEEHLKAYDSAVEKARHEAGQKATRERIAKIKAFNAVPGAEQKPVPNATFRAFADQNNSQHRPSVLFNAMVSPLIPYTVKGAIWYQGESNQGRAVQYQDLLPLLIKDWRSQWKDEFSFYIVQLASYGNGKTWPQPVGANDTWAELQWAQLQTAINTPKCGLAVANDIGEMPDIHPKNKQEVGRRLALQALAKDYHKKDLVASGPTYESASVSGNKFLVSFTSLGGGLKSRDGGDLKGFLVAGEDKMFKTAQAKIVGKQVQVWSDEVSKPVAVRYAWASWCPEANLVNQEGLPATLFRTDKWDLYTKGTENPFVQVKAAIPTAVPPPLPATTPSSTSPATEPPKKGVQPAAEPQSSPQKKAA